MRDRRLAIPWAHVAGVAALTTATWLYLGYRFNVWPQPGFLDYVLRFDGQLSNDWHTSLPPVHWAVDHALGAVPYSALSTVAFVLWLAGIVALWTGFVSLAESFGLTATGALGAGLVAIPTTFGGVGISDPLFNYLYPTGTSFSLVVCALAALVRRRLIAAGVLLGAATVVHPNLGALAAATIAPAVLLLPGSRWRNIVRLGVPLAVLALPILAQVAADQTGGATFTPSRRYDLLVIVRQPHHMLFSFFPVSEYLRTGLWVAVGAAGVALLWRTLAARVAIVVAALTGVFLAAGAIASQARGPLIVVQLQTSRLSPQLVLLGILLGGGALMRLAPRWTPFALTAIAVLATPVHNILKGQLSVYTPRLMPWVTNSAVEAALLLVALTGVLLAMRRRWRAPAFVPDPAQATAVALVVAAVVLVALHGERVGSRGPQDAAYMDVAAHARQFAKPGQLVLTPPDMDGFRDYARLPVVVEFGTFRYGEGDAEWVRRMNSLTGDPKLLDPSLGTDVPARVAAIGRAYDHTVATDRTPICEYDARLVVAHAGVKTPPWLVLVYRNAYFELFGIKSRTCPAPASL